MKNRLIIVLMMFLLIMLSTVSKELDAATKTWTGSVSTDWNEANNWFEAGVPLSGDDVTIPTSPTGGRMPTISSGTFSTNKLTIQSGASVTQSGGTLTPTDVTSISGLFIQIAGTFSTTKNLTVNAGGSLSIAGSFTSTGTTAVAGTFTQTSGSFSGAAFDVSSTGIVNYSGTSFTTNENKITIDGGTFNQTGGTVSTKDMELKNGGTYYQTSGEFQISHDLKSPAGTTFNQVGGTIRFTGAAGAGAVYTGVVQFYNLIVDPGATYNMNSNSDTIRVAGNFTNNNSSLKCDVGTLILNGTSAQTFYSASSNNVAANVVVSCPNVTLQSDLRVKTSFILKPGGHVNKNGFKIYQNGVEYTGPTPVELVAFNAKVKNNVVFLDWRTATEVNNYGFEVERSSGSDNWDKIGFVNGHGNSNSPKEYYFEDSKLSNNSYEYRLKQVDNDGTFSYSNVVSVTLNQLPSNFVLNQNYPNPFNPSTKISWQSPVSGWQTLKVYDILGNEVATLVNEFREAGFYEVEFNASSLSSGAYIYKIQVYPSNGGAGNFSETMKMLLTK